MKRCVIFCGGGFSSLDGPILDTDLVIAADKGLDYTRQLGLNPQIVLGDFDSLGYIPAGAEVHPVEKDDTDAMLAARRGLELGYKEFVFYGSLDGPRLDHTVSNFQTLQFLADRGATAYLVGNHYIVTVLKNGSLTFQAECSGILSVFCMGADATGVTIRGAQYELENGTLSAGFPLGVSNHFTGEPAEISVREGGAKGIMTSYNKLNGVYTPNSYDLCTKVLRNEWGFDGVVMTDWFSTGGNKGSTARCMSAGNDLIMPGGGSFKKEILKGIKSGKIKEEDLRRCCGNVVKAIFGSATQKEYIK